MITRLLIALNVIGYLWEFSVGGPGMLAGFGQQHGMERVLVGGRADPGRGPARRPMVAHHHRRVSARRIASYRRQYAVAVVSRAIHRIRARARGACSSSTWSRWSSRVSASSIFSNPMMPTVGASGAIFGLFGALFAIGFKLGKPGMDLVRANVGILVLNLIITFTVPQISWQAHVAGLLAGFVLTYVDIRAAATGRSGGRRRDYRPRTRNRIRIAGSALTS